MAEAYVNSKVTSSTKKRKNESNNTGKNKKITSLFKTQDNEDVIVLKEDPRNNHPKSIMKPGTSKQLEPGIINVEMKNDDQINRDKDIEIIDLNAPLKRTFHVGGDKYIIFTADKGVIDQIQIKEWDGHKVIKKGVKLNISKLMMIMHYGQLITSEIGKIGNGQEDIDVKKHIGGGYYLSCASPYKSVGIRLWKLGTVKMFPTNEGINLKINEWMELIDVINDMYVERLDLFHCVSCLLQPNQPGHNPNTCKECMQNTDVSRGEVYVDIPL